MVDFEARRGPFADWDNERRKHVLTRLLGITGRHVSLFWGFSDFPADIRGVAGFRNAYQANLIKTLKELVFQVNEIGEPPIKLVFSKHKNISAEWIGRYFDFFSYWLGDKVEFAGFGDPDKLPPLQVADVIAYEFSRTAREHRPIKESYPLLKVPWNGEYVHFIHASTIAERRI